MTNLYYCSECLHVYDKIPGDMICEICHVSMSAEDQIDNLDILTCETCNYVYTNQNFDKVVNTEKKMGDSGLCSCINQCPPNTLFKGGNKGQKKLFFTGSIVKADIYQCNNCKATYYWNREKHDKKCAECNSKIIIPMNYDPETQQLHWNCGNPDHAIRLKIRDLVLNHNEDITNSIKSSGLMNKLKDVKNKYTHERNRIDFEKGRFNKAKTERKMKDLDEWAKQERIKLYTDLAANSLKCAVYRQEVKGNVKTIKNTGDGCNANAHLRIRTILKSDKTATIFGIPEIQEEEEEEFIIETPEEVKLSGAVPKSPVFDDVKAEVTLAPDSIPTATQVELPETLSTIEEVSAPEIEEIDETEIYSKLPAPTEKQMYITIKISSLSSKSTGIVFGVLPIEFQNRIGTIKLGKSTMTQKTFWNEPEKMVELKGVFSNIGEEEIILEKENEQFKIQKGDKSVNKIKIINTSGSNSLELPVQIDKNTLNTTKLMMKCYSYVDKYLIHLGFQL